MTAKTGVEKEQKQTQHKESLKGALADVLERSKQKTGDSTQEMSKPVAAAPPRENPPFEVSEDALRKVFKDEI
jgi:hypothetical protein